MNPSTPTLHLGTAQALDGSGASQPLTLPTEHLVTHGVIVGMTGSGKTGLSLVFVEETLRARVPVLMVDVKGDLSDLLLAFPSLESTPFVPWLPAGAPANTAEKLAAQRRDGLAAAHLTENDLRAFHDSTAVRVITPGAHTGEMLHVLSSLEHPSPLWSSDEDSARSSLSAVLSLVLRLLGRDPDPARSRDHVVLSVLAERRLRAGQSADLGALLADLESPPIDRIGAMELDAFLPPHDRRTLSTALNTLLASPTFSSWRQGTGLDVDAWLAPRADGRTPAVIVSVAHLDDTERTLMLGLLLEEVSTWVRGLPGTDRLRALVVFDEVYGFLPPHPANPPTKRPLIALLKQARAFGVGILLATQNPMDLDYRALGNAGLWCIGRLQTDADRARVVDGLTNAGDASEDLDREVLDETVKKLARGWFIVRDVHRTPSAFLLRVRWAMSWLRGPMTRTELRTLVSAAG